MKLGLTFLLIAAIAASSGALLGGGVEALKNLWSVLFVLIAVASTIIGIAAITNE